MSNSYRHFMAGLYWLMSFSFNRDVAAQGPSWATAGAEEIEDDAPSQLRFFYRLAYTLSSVSMKPVVRLFLIGLLEALIAVLKSGELLYVKDIAPDGKVNVIKGLGSEVVDAVTALNPFATDITKNLSLNTVFEVGDANEKFLANAILLDPTILIVESSQRASGVTSDTDAVLGEQNKIVKSIRDAFEKETGVNLKE